MDNISKPFYDASISNIPPKELYKDFKDFPIEKFKIGLSLVDFGKGYKNIVALNVTNILEECKVGVEQLGYLRRKGLRELYRGVVSNMSRNKVNKNFISNIRYLLKLKIEVLKIRRTKKWKNLIATFINTS